MSEPLSAILRRASSRPVLPPPEERRALRLACRITQADLAEALGVTRPTVTRYETGRRMPHGARLDAYAEALTLMRDHARRRRAGGDEHDGR